MPCMSQVGEEGGVESLDAVMETSGTLLERLLSGKIDGDEVNAELEENLNGKSDCPSY